MPCISGPACARRVSVSAADHPTAGAAIAAPAKSATAATIDLFMLFSNEERRIAALDMQARMQSSPLFSSVED
jgi:hypothetical protein